MSKNLSLSKAIAKYCTNNCGKRSSACNYCELNLFAEFVKDGCAVEEKPETIITQKKTAYPSNTLEVKPATLIVGEATPAVPVVLLVPPSVKGIVVKRK